MVLRFPKRVSSFRLAALAAVISAPLLAFATDASAGGGLPPYAMPTHFASAAQPEAVTASACTLTYVGGAIIPKVQVVNVYWGTPSTYVTQSAGAIAKEVVSSKYIDQLAEYNTTSRKIVRGSYVGAYSITPSITGKSVANEQIGPELQKQIDAGNLPQPAFDSVGNSNTIYVIFFAAGITISLTQQGQTAHSCVEFCGYHFGFKFSNNKPVRYAVVPDMAKGSSCTGGCGVGEAASIGDTISHEVAEAITDPDIWTQDTSQIGWYDVSHQGCGEIGDICAPGGPDPGAGDGTLDGFTLQYLWSEKNQTCQLTSSASTPQAGCSSNADCAAPVPICDTTSKSCVGCQSNSDCSGPRPTCDTKLEVCRPCTSNSDCSAPTAICVTNAAPGAATNGSCVECLENKDCPNTKPLCSSNVCTGCQADADCSDPANPSCNTGSGACGPPPGSSSGSGGSGGGNGDTTTTTTGGCAVSDGPASNALTFGGLLFGLAALVRAKRSRARR